MKIIPKCKIQFIFDRFMNFTIKTPTWIFWPPKTLFLVFISALKKHLNCNWNYTKRAFVHQPKTCCNVTTRVRGPKLFFFSVLRLAGSMPFHGRGVCMCIFVEVSTDPFIDFSMLQLYKTSTDSSNVALLIREGDPPCSLGVLQLWVCVDACIAHPPYSLSMIIASSTVRNTIYLMLKSLETYTPDCIILSTSFMIKCQSRYIFEKLLRK